MANIPFVIPSGEHVAKSMELQIPQRFVPQDAYNLQYTQLTEFQCITVKPFLDGCPHIIDLGCGLGRFGAGLYKFGICTKLTMADYDDFFEKKPNSRWQADGYFPHNSREATKDFLDANNIRNWGFYDLGDGLEGLPKADAIVSVFSVGFHYPIQMDILYDKASTFIFGVSPESESRQYHEYSFGDFEFRTRKIVNPNHSRIPRSQRPFLVLRK